ncbi:MAG: pyridoxal-phosphate dependent enzyme [Dehalococcoidia bacterium]|nr:pyridoxal-phosphate dependent enzyme [Dehalococcoidia bacterium]
MNIAMTERQDCPPQFTITCQKCGEAISAETWQWRHSCEGTLRLDVAVDASRVAACGSPQRGMVRFGPVLPLCTVTETAVGDTPLQVENYEGVRIGMKLEYLNPGGSFKDRGAYVTVARLVELGYEAIVVDSSGNAGVAMALMGRRFGLRVSVFLPCSTPEGKKSLLRVLGAALHEVEGDRMSVHTATLAYAEASGAAYAGHWFNPYFAHGVKTMAYEAVTQLADIDYAFCPVGAGTVLLGLHTGFDELRGAHVTVRPRLVAVQAAGYSPVSERLGVAGLSGQRSHLADGIAIAAPPREREIAAAVHDTGGFGAIVGDTEIAQALTWLIARGYIVEPTSAVALAALFKSIRNGLVPKGSTVLLPLTGTGMKVLDHLEHAIRSEASH